MKSGKRYWVDGTVVAGQQFEYGFDDIGNRKTAVSGGSQFGTSLRTNTYAANLLNQYTNRSVLGYVEVQGSAHSNATVTVNNESTYRKGDYFRKELSVNNSSAAVWQGITNVAVLNGAGTNGTDIVSTKTGNVLVPKTPEAFSHDTDGNTIQDGRWNYSWDGENRLTRLESLTNAPADSRLKLDFAYDQQFRRVQKVVSLWSGSAYVAQSTNRFLYDGWNLTAILDGNSSLLQSFRWGTDLSGSQQGAGGVGGLFSMTVHQGTNGGTYFYSYDGNGNVAALVSAANGTVVARYEYGPFGELLRATGPLAFLNPFRFSTKFCDDESGLLYYGYRYYDPSSGRWPSRDPIEEQGGMHIYAFCANRSLGIIDLLGLAVTITGPDKIVALDKTFPDSQGATYSVSGTLTGLTRHRWWAYGKIKIIGGVYGSTVRVAATGPSKPKQDSKIGVCDPVFGIVFKPVTVIVPRTITRPTRGSTPGASMGGMFMLVKFKWKVLDQFTDPLPGVLVNLSAPTDLSSAGLPSLGTPRPTFDTTDASGEFEDTYKGTFGSITGFRNFEQTITVGNWTTGAILTRWDADRDGDLSFDGSYSGGGSFSFR